MSGPTYDPSIIRQHAAALYARAGWTVFLWTVLLGALAGIAASFYFFPRYPVGDTTRMGVPFFGIVGLVVGYIFGSSRAFVLKLQAQMALCQVAIEENTRAKAVPPAP